MARTTTSRTGTSQTSMGQTEMTKKKAYELYEKRGKRPGHALDDWLEAERIVRQRSF